MSRSLLKYSIGIDVSGEELQCSFVEMDTRQQVASLADRTFGNRPGQFAELDRWIRKHRRDRALPLVVTMEATGIYHEAAAMFLHKKNHQVCVVLPNKARRYMQALGLKSKNDRIDARGLARMGAEQCLKTWQPGNPTLYEIRTLSRHVERLQNMKTDLRNQLHAHCRMALPSKTVIRQLKKSMKHLDKQLGQLKGAIEKQVGSDEELLAKVRLITDNIKGVGLMTACVVIAETNGFELFENTRQLTSFAGYDVVENQSGKRRGRTRISKQGNSHIRRILHMPALNVVRFGVEPFSSVWQRIFQRTGVKMKAYVAIQRKLLVLIYTLYKKDEAFETVPCTEAA